MSRYHQQSEYRRGAMSGHFLDWAHQPSPFKEYLYRDLQPLPRPHLPRADFWSLAWDWPPRPPSPRQEVSAGDLAAVLLMSAGITARAGRVGLRASASAGALYPAELYAIACGVEGLEDGLYHFAPQGPGLHRLWPASLAAAAGRLLGAPPARLTLVVTAMFWRSLWKYLARGYRYCLLDAGHLLANLELACAAVGLAPRTTLDFVDESLGVLLGLASEDEVPLAAVSAGPRPEDPGPPQPPLPPLDLQAKPLSTAIGRDSSVLAAHAQANLDQPLPPRTWSVSRPEGEALQLDHPRNQCPPADLVQVIRSRRSRRDFLPAALDARQAAAVLAASLPVPAACQATVLVAPGGEIPGGTYRYLPGLRLLVPVEVPRDRRADLAAACLGQGWLARAGLVVVFWAPLERLIQEAGPRAYRHAMLSAGRAGQRVYLAATALKLGCCGVGAFYDQELARAAALPEGASPLYLVACGPVGD